MGPWHNRMRVVAEHVVPHCTAEEPYVPPLQLTEGQPPPIAAHGGLSYTSFSDAGDAGTTRATEEALEQIVSGEGQRVNDMIDSASPGPITTKWGVGYARMQECLDAMTEMDLEVPEGGAAIPLRYTVFEQPSYSIVSSNALWHDPMREAEQNLFRKDERDNGRRALYFPQVVRDARRIEHYYPGLIPRSAECMDRLGISLAEQHSACTNFYDHEEVERIFYPEIEKLLLDYFPGAVDALVYNHDVFDKGYEGDRTEDQDAKNPGVNATYANLVHNDLNDNSGRVRCRELLTKNLRNFGRNQSYTEEEADIKMSRRFMSINLAKPIETVHQNPFILCAWPSFANQRYINNYRVYDDRVGETTRFTYRPEHDWFWLPRQEPHEISMLKCYDSVADGSKSRWSFHTACIDPSMPRDAPNRKNVVVRSFVFFDS